MIIKPVVQLYFLLLLAVLFLQCDKKISNISSTDTPLVEEPVLLGHRTDRNDIPPAPLSPWWTIVPEELTTCQRKLWAYLKKIYPIKDSINPEYQIYTIRNQAGNIYFSNDVINPYVEYFSNKFPQEYLYNEDYSCPEELDGDFFKGALGEPTCIAQNYVDSVITYFYYIKLRYRYGPCPFTHFNGEEIGSHCGSSQIQYCSTLRAIFSMETGQLLYIDFST